MRKYIANKKLNQFEKRYDYDVSYLRYMLDSSPTAFFKFAKLMNLSQHREAAPAEVLYAAKLVGALAEDCGPCLQIVVHMALEAGMAGDQIAAILKRDAQAMNEETALGFRFADAVVRRAANEDEIRDAVRARWGDKGVIDLTLGLQIGRLIPMVKAGFGFAKSCQRVRIGDDLVDVVKEAA